MRVRLAAFRMVMISFFCASAERPVLLGKFRFQTEATQAPRKSWAGEEERAMRKKQRRSKVENEEREKIEKFIFWRD